MHFKICAVVTVLGASWVVISRDIRTPNMVTMVLSIVTILTALLITTPPPPRPAKP